MENNYYVYARIRLDNNTPFYIGKGHNDRINYFPRNKLHDKIAQKYGYRTDILIDNLTEEEAYHKENETILQLINEGYGIDITGLRGDDETHFLTNRTFGGRGSEGISNPQYNVSPKERMSEEVYEQWHKKVCARCANQYGENNPNYHNDTLKKKLIDNPELKMIYYSRPGSQNGRARGIIAYDSFHNFLNSFLTIGECCEWLKEQFNFDAKIDSMRANISLSIKKNKPYKDMWFEFVD